MPLESNLYLISEYTLLIIHDCRNNGDIWLSADPSLRSNQNLRQYFLVPYSGFGVVQLVRFLRRTAMVLIDISSVDVFSLRTHCQDPAHLPV